MRNGYSFDPVGVMHSNPGMSQPHGTLQFSRRAALTGALAAGAAACQPKAPVSQAFLNVSYDPTRELYEAYNTLFAQHWAGLHADAPPLHVEMSHGGSGR